MRRKDRVVGPIRGRDPFKYHDPTRKPIFLVGKGRRYSVNSTVVTDPGRPTVKSGENRRRRGGVKVKRQRYPGGSRRRGEEERRLCES